MHTFWFVMLIQAGSPAVYVEPGRAYTDPVDCQMEVIRLRDIEPTKTFECKPLKSNTDLTRPVKAKK